MPPRLLLAAAFAITCLALAGCKDQREPAKPIVDLSRTVLDR
jgi:hypothetical protein